MITRPAILLLVLLCSLSAFGQKYSWKRALPGMACSFVAGNANGIHETINYHYDRFEAVFPTANAQYWNPGVSWTNKYKDGNPALGARFPGSTSLLVFSTDANHLANNIHRAGLISGTCFATIGDRRPWWHYAINIGANYLAYEAGFHLQYSLIFRRHP